MIRQYTQCDIPDMVRIWNEVVEEGIAFPQEECLDLESGSAFFSSQSYMALLKSMGRLRDYIFSIPIMWEGAAISAMQVMRFLRMFEATISVNNWCWTV